MTVNLKEFNLEQIKQIFWDLFIQITTISAHIGGGKEIDLTEETPLSSLITNIAFWMALVIIILFMVILFYKTKLCFI